MLEKVPFANPACVRMEFLCGGILHVFIRESTRMRTRDTRRVITPTFQSSCSAHNGGGGGVQAGQCVNAFDKCSFFYSVVLYARNAPSLQIFFCFFKSCCQRMKGSPSGPPSLRPVLLYSFQGGCWTLLLPPSLGVESICGTSVLSDVFALSRF